jgi:hypothetical protein
MGAVNMYVGSLNTAITLNFRLDRIGQVELTTKERLKLESLAKGRSSSLRGPKKLVIMQSA